MQDGLIKTSTRPLGSIDRELSLLPSWLLPMLRIAPKTFVSDDGLPFRLPPTAGFREENLSSRRPFQDVSRRVIARTGLEKVQYHVVRGSQGHRLHCPVEGVVDVLHLAPKRVVTCTAVSGPARPPAKQWFLDPSDKIREDGSSAHFDPTLGPTSPVGVLACFPEGVVPELAGAPVRVGGYP